MSEPLSSAISAQRAGQSIAAAPADGAETQVFSCFFKLKADVFFFDEANWRGERKAARDKDRLAVADSKGFAPGEPVEEVLRQIAERNLGVTLQGGGEHVFASAVSEP